MDDDRSFSQSRVPLRTVLASMVGLWACYFVLVSLRGFLADLEYQGELLALRGLVSLLSVAVTVLLWLLLRMFDHRRLGLRIAVALVAALPAALLLAFVNQFVFADVERRASEKRAERQGLRLRQDDAGNILVDVPGLPARGGEAQEGATTETPATDNPAPETPAPAAGPETRPQARDSITINTITPQDMMWRQLTDIALGRYFLLLAWAALYVALTQAQSVRAAERREGEYRRAAKAAELRSLRYQVNPHFLFNTLNSLSALVMTGRNAQAEAMIQSISTFYRRSLAGDPSDDVALADEIELQRVYLRIEAVRFPDRLRTVFDIPPELEDARVPGMILQPLIENSIKYAVARVSHPVTIHIDAAEEYGRLVLTIADDGPGGEPADGGEGCGIGLANVRNRLEARYGENATLASGETGKGWRSVLRLPLESMGRNRQHG